jgi:hypothetical protein
MGLFWMTLLVSCSDEPPSGRDPAVFCSCGAGPVPDDVVTEWFTVASPEKLDLLFVLDSSGPLADPTPLVENAAPWLDPLFLRQHDLHLGVVTADLDDPAHQGQLIEAQGVKWIDSSTPDPLGVFAELVQVGTGGSPTVQALGATYHALEVHHDTFNAGFLRDDSAVQVIVVSDGDDETEPGLPVGTEFVDWLDALRPGGRSLSCLNVGDPVSTDCADIAAGLGGIEGDVADPAAHEAIRAPFQGPQMEFFLSQLPVPQSLEVAVEQPSGALYEFAETEDWAYDLGRNSVRFLQYVPEQGSVVIVDYNAAAD